MRLENRRNSPRLTRHQEDTKKLFGQLVDDLAPKKYVRYHQLHHRWSDGEDITEEEKKEFEELYKLRNSLEVPKVEVGNDIYNQIRMPDPGDFRSLMELGKSYGLTSMDVEQMDTIGIIKHVLREQIFRQHLRQEEEQLRKDTGK